MDDSLGLNFLNNQISFSWDMHYACNYRCPYCWWDGRWQELAKLNRYLSVKQWMKYWRNIYSRYRSVAIEILGGEPFIYPNFTELIKELSSMHNIRITTNLSTDIEDFISQIEPSKLKIIPTFHPLFAEFDSFVKKTLLLKENGFTGGILYLAYPPQIKQMPYYKERFNQEGLSLSVMTFWGEYRGITYPDGYTEEEREIIGAHLAKRSGEEYQLAPKRMPKGRLCRAGQKYAVVQGDGNVIRCGGSGLDERIGSFFDENFRLLEKPMPCKAEYCKCNEWASLLVEDGKEEDSDKIGDHEEKFDREVIKCVQDNDKPIYLKNKELNARELAERKIILESKPMMLGIIVTNRCNLDCIICSTPRKKSKNTLSKAAVEKISDLLPYVMRINWQGGEIFCVDYLKELFRSLIPYQHITNEITTNGLLLDAEWMEILIHLRLNLLFSIDSVVEKTYEYIRRGARFNELIKRLKFLNEFEQRFHKEIDKVITAVVMKCNYQELDLFIDFAKQYGFHKIIFTPVVFFDNEENIFLKMTPEIKSNLKRGLERVKERASAQGVGVLCTIADFEFSLPCVYKKGTDDNNIESLDLSKQGLFCVYPWKSLWIDASRQGNIYLDCWCQQDIGNIYRDSLLEVWNNETMQTYRRKLAAEDKRLCKLCVDKNRVMP